MNVPSSAAPLESTDAKFDHPLINNAKNPKAPIECDKYKFSIPASCLRDATVLFVTPQCAALKKGWKKRRCEKHLKGLKGMAIQIRVPKGQRGGGPGNLMKLQRKTYTVDVACAKTHAQIPFGGKMTLKTSTEVCCNCPECSQPEYECKNQKGDKYCDETAKKNICSTEQGIKDCRKSCHRCPHNFPKCGGTCYTENYGRWQPIISKDSEEIKLNGKDLDLSNEWQVCVAAALQEHATVEQRKGAAGDIGNMAGGGGYIGGGFFGGGELGESAGVGRRGSAGAPMMNPSFKMSANRAGNDEEVDLGESVGRRGSFSPVGSFSLTAGANRAGNDEEEEEL